MRPLYTCEAAEILIFDPDAYEGGGPKFGTDWLSESEAKEQELLSACPSLITIVDNDRMRVVQFSHFSVKEFLTSGRLATFSEDISRYHILPEPAHTILAQASLEVLLGLDDRVSTFHPLSNPLVEYAKIHWVSHAQAAN